MKTVRIRVCGETKEYVWVDNGLMERNAYMVWRRDITVGSAEEQPRWKEGSDAGMATMDMVRIVGLLD